MLWLLDNRSYETRTGSISSTDDFKLDILKAGHSAARYRTQWERD